MCCKKSLNKSKIEIKYYNFSSLKQILLIYDYETFKRSFVCYSRTNERTERISIMLNQVVLNLI